MLQRELASKLSIGEGFLSKIEHEQKLPKREDLQKLSRIFNVSIIELETLWLGSKLYDLIKNEYHSLDALKVAEEQIKYRKNKK